MGSESDVQQDQTPSSEPSPVAAAARHEEQQLLLEGTRSSATQAEYGEEHVRRLRVIRALIDSGVIAAMPSRT